MKTVLFHKPKGKPCSGTPLDVLDTGCGDARLTLAEKLADTRPTFDFRPGDLILALEVEDGTDIAVLTPYLYPLEIPQRFALGAEEDA
jgi:hypothetical protein